jgi:hypothetical protein
MEKDARLPVTRYPRLVLSTVVLTTFSVSAVAILVLSRPRATDDKIALTTEDYHDILRTALASAEHDTDFYFIVQFRERVNDGLKSELFADANGLGLRGWMIDPSSKTMRSVAMVGPRRKGETEVLDFKIDYSKVDGQWRVDVTWLSAVSSRQ